MAGGPWRAPVGLLMAGMLLLSACTVGSSVPRGTDRPTRPADVIPCPRVELAGLAESFRPVHRELRALSDNHMGQVATYRAGRRSLTVYSGPDLYDALEDLDTTAESVDTGRYSFTLYSTLLAPGLLIAVLDVGTVAGDAFAEPCDNAGVLAHRVQKRDLVDLLEGFRVVDARGPRQSRSATR